MKDAAPAPTVLILGGVSGEAAAMANVLSESFDCLLAAEVGEAWSLMAEKFVQVVICAGHLPGAPCETVFEDLRAHWPETRLIAISDPGREPPVSPNLEQVLARPWSPTELRVATATEFATGSSPVAAGKPQGRPYKDSGSQPTPIVRLPAPTCSRRSRSQMVAP
ncbi:MAG: hypothetical protein AAF675_06970 [Pseudomonadota bacterium]